MPSAATNRAAGWPLARTVSKRTPTRTPCRLSPDRKRATRRTPYIGSWIAGAPLRRRVEARTRLVDVPPGTREQLPAVGLGLARDGRGFRVAVTEHLVQQEHEL
jgi:hypothetical protein